MSELVVGVVSWVLVVVHGGRRNKPCRGGGDRILRCFCLPALVSPHVWLCLETCSYGWMVGGGDMRGDGGKWWWWCCIQVEINAILDRPNLSYLACAV